MSNLGPHLRNIQHHTLLPTQEQPYSQFDLHMHDQQHMIYHALAFTTLQHASL